MTVSIVKVDVARFLTARWQPACLIAVSVIKCLDNQGVSYLNHGGTVETAASNQAVLAGGILTINSAVIFFGVILFAIVFEIESLRKVRSSSTADGVCLPVRGGCDR